MRPAAVAPGTGLEADAALAAELAHRVEHDAARRRGRAARRDRARRSPRAARLRASSVSTTTSPSVSGGSNFASTFSTNSTSDVVPSTRTATEWSEPAATSTPRSSQQLAEVVEQPPHELGLPGARHRARGDADGLRGHADRQLTCRDVGDDVRVRRDDRLAAEPAAGVDDGAEPDLRAILEHDRREAVLEALEHRVPDVVRDEHRPHGHEHLAADDDRPARVDERLVADEGEVADDERRPWVARGRRRRRATSRPK